MFKTDLPGDGFEMAVLGCRSLVLDKCQFLTRPNVLIVLLECIDLFSLSGKMKQTLGGLPCPLPFYIAVFYFEFLLFQ